MASPGKGFADFDNETGPRVLECKIGPEGCLKRVCRICSQGMELDYGFDHEHRWYTFYCARCGTIVRVCEEIMKSWIEQNLRDRCILEALTEDEKALQNSNWIARTARKLVAKKRFHAKTDAGRPEKHVLSWDEAKKLR